jgi:hypothetical protein
MPEIIIWQSLVNEGNIESVVNDGTFIYVLVDPFPALTNAFLVKINTVTRTEVGRWSIAPVGAGPTVIDAYYQDNYVYVTAELAQNCLIKINPATMTEVTRWNNTVDGAALNQITGDGTDLYVLGGVPAEVFKINPATMAYVSRWTGNAIQDLHSNSIVYANGFVFAGTGNITSTQDYIRKINTSNMTLATSWVGPWGSLGPMVVDSINLYFGSPSGTLTKVDQGFATTVLTVSDPTLSYESLAFVNGRLISGTLIVPAGIIISISAIDTASLTSNTIDFITVTAGSENRGLTGLASQIFVGINAASPSQASILQILPPPLVTVHMAYPVKRRLT